MSDDAGAQRARILALLVVTSAQFMAVMSTSSVSVALPTIGRGLHAQQPGDHHRKVCRSP